MKRRVSKSRIQWVLFLFLLSLYVLTTAGYPTTSMCSSMCSAAIHLVEEGTVALDQPTLETGVGKDGRYYVYEGLAVILVVAVFTAISKFIGIFPHGIFMTNHILTAVACILLFVVGRELRYSKKTSVLLALIYGVGTMAWVHSRYLMPEPLTTVVFVSAFLFLLKYKKKKEGKWLALCGTFTGLALIVRPDAPLFILGMTVGVFALLSIQYRDGKKARMETVKEGLLFILPLIVFFGVYAYYNYARFGSFFELGYSTKGQVDEASEETGDQFRVRNIGGTLLGFAGMWILPCRSMFFINPVLIFIFWAVKDFWKKHKYEFIVMGIPFFLYVLLYTNRGPSGFPGSSAWGIRYMVPMTSFMVVVMGPFVEKIVSGRRRATLLRVFIIIFSVSALFQFVGASMSYQVTQGYLKEHYETPDDEWAARRMMNLDPRWNLLTQNMKWLFKGDTDFLYYNSLNRSDGAIASYLWGEEIPNWVGISFGVFLITFLYSGYLLSRFLLIPTTDSPQTRTTGRRRKRREVP